MFAKEWALNANKSTYNLERAAITMNILISLLNHGTNSRAIIVLYEAQYQILKTAMRLYQYNMAYSARLQPRHKVARKAPKEPRSTKPQKLGKGGPVLPLGKVLEQNNRGLTIKLPPRRSRFDSTGLLILICHRNPSSPLGAIRCS